MRRFDVFEGGLLATRDAERIAFASAVAQAGKPAGSGVPSTPPSPPTRRLSPSTLAMQQQAAAGRAERVSKVAALLLDRSGRLDKGRLCQFGVACLAATLASGAALSWHSAVRAPSAAPARDVSVPAPILVTEATLPASIPDAPDAEAQVPPAKPLGLASADTPASLPAEPAVQTPLQAAPAQTALASAIPPEDAAPAAPSPAPATPTLRAASADAKVIAPRPRILRVLARAPAPTFRAPPLEAAAHAAPRPRPPHATAYARYDLPAWLLRSHEAHPASLVMSPQPHDLAVPQAPQADSQTRSAANDDAPVEAARPAPQPELPHPYAAPIRQAHMAWGYDRYPGPYSHPAPPPYAYYGYPGPYAAYGPYGPSPYARPYMPPPGYASED